MEENLVFQCPGCGNQLYAKNAIDGLVECDHCGQLRSIPRADSSDRAVHFLLVGEHELDTGKFNEAYDAYAKAAELSPKEPEAFFGMALSELQVRYIKDNVNNRLQPICYDSSQKKFEDNANYKKALTLATVSQKAEYEKRAKAVDYIKKEFAHLKQSGLDYDCFICVKVTDENGGKTPDSAAAEYIYDLLKRNGFTPFYSEREIRNRQGVDYEAAILYALHTSETMLVVCYKEEYLLTKWVKNEYTRFLKLQNDGEKECDSISIIFYEKPIGKLPGRSGQLQGIDFESRAADGQIVEFVKNHTPEARKRREEEVKKKAEHEEEIRRQIEESKRRQQELEENLKSIQSRGEFQSANATVNSLFERGSMELASADFHKAKEYFNRVLDIQPKYAEAWWGLFLCEFNAVHQKAMLYIDKISEDQEKNIKQSKNLKNATQFATGDFKKVVDEFNTQFNELISAKSLCNYGYRRLSEGLFPGAKIFFNRSIKADNEYAEAWWGLFLCEANVTHENKILIEKKESIDSDYVKYISNSELFKNALKFGDKNIKSRIAIFLNGLRGVLNEKKDGVLQNKNLLNKDIEAKNKEIQDKYEEINNCNKEIKSLCGYNSSEELNNNRPISKTYFKNGFKKSWLTLPTRGFSKFTGILMQVEEPGKTKKKHSCIVEAVLLFVSLIGIILSVLATPLYIVNYIIAVLLALIYIILWSPCLWIGNLCVKRKNKKIDSLLYKVVAIELNIDGKKKQLKEIESEIENLNSNIYQKSLAIHNIDLAMSKVESYINGQS